MVDIILLFPDSFAILSLLDGKSIFVEPVLFMNSPEIRLDHRSVHVQLGEIDGMLFAYSILNS